MSDDNKLQIGIEADVTGSDKAEDLANTLADVNDALRSLVSEARKAASELTKTEKSLSGIDTATKAAQGGTQKLADANTQLEASAKQVVVHTYEQAAGLRALSEQYAATALNAQKLSSYMNRSTATNTSNPDAGSRNYRNASTAVDDWVALNRDANKKIGQALVSSMQERFKAEDSYTSKVQAESKVRVQAYTKEYQEAVRLEKSLADAQQAKRYATPVNPARNTASPIAAATAQDAYKAQELAQLNKHYADLEKSSRKAAEGQSVFKGSLANTRYALHDVSMTLGLVSAGLLAGNIAVVGAAAGYEQAMAKIQRTAETTSGAMVGIRNDFVELAQTVPLAFGELAEIGMLAGQLNVPAENISKFVETTAKFAATTNVTTDAAATAFGRLDALLPDVQGNYEALGSSMLKVGVNSVATETEIIATTSQIAAAGAQAGFTADQVIGLASSFASLGVAPEAARGTTLRTLTAIRDAITDGGYKLKEFARLSGMSSDAFKADWQNSATTAQTFIKVLAGLQKEGAGAEDAIRGVGIWAARDRNALLKLSQNVEVVSENFHMAAEGMQNTGLLSENFAVQAGTLQSKLQILTNSLEAFFATMGQQSTSALGFFVDGLNSILKLATELAKSPFVQWTALVVGTITSLVGALGIGIALLTRFGASVIAARDVMRSFAAASREAGGGALGFAGALRTAALASSALGVAIRAALISTGIGVLIGGIATAVDLLATKFKSGAQAAKELYGADEELSNALRKDTQTVKAGEEGYKALSGTLKTVTQSVDGWVDGVNEATGGHVRVNDAAIKSKEAYDDLTLSIGTNSKAIIANRLANDEAIQKLIQKIQLLKPENQPDIQGFFTKALNNDIPGAEKILDDYKQKLVEIQLQGKDGWQFDVGQGEAALSLMRGALENVSGQFKNAATQTQVLEIAASAMGLQIDESTGKLKAMGDDADNAVENVEDLSTAIKNAFADQNTMIAFAANFETLVKGIADGGASFDEFNAAGRANLENLQKSIESTVKAGELLGISATESVAVMFAQLRKEGVDTANLMSKLSGLKIPNVSFFGVGQYLSGTKEFSRESTGMAKAMSQVATQGRAAAKSTKAAGKAAKEAKQEIRTLADYASDLQKVFSRSFQIRFGAEQSGDKIGQTWSDMQKTVTEAQKAIADSTADLNQKLREHQAQMAELSSDRKIQEYWLSVAETYGDALRAGELRAKLTTIDDKMAKSNDDYSSAVVKNQEIVQAAQDKLNKSLQGNTDVARANRDEILKLVNQYQDYIAELASSGMSQAELTQRTSELHAEFVRQATQLGFSTSELGKYEIAFYDVKTAIDRLPRTITVAYDPNPVIQAMNEMAAKTKTAAERARNDANNALRGIGGSVGSLNLAPIDDPIKKSQRLLGLYAQQSILSLRVATSSNLPVKVGYMAQMAAIENLIRSGGYKSGGYTGGGGVNDVSGVVHGKEYVINAENTKRLGLPMLNALNNGATPAVQNNSSNNGIMVVELSAYDRNLLKQAGNVNVTLSSSSIANAGNSSNANQSRRGG